MRARTVALGGLAALGGALGMTAHRRYRLEMSLIRERLERESKVVETSFGAVEYAERGEGEAVLVSHAPGGGYDQGMLIAESWIGDGARCIAPSRFGYLRSAAPENATPEMQADAWLELLDALEIDRTAVIGMAAGAFSAMQFALRHPGRVSALILVSTAGWCSPTDLDIQPRRLCAYLPLVMRDFGFWSAATYAGAAVAAALGAPPVVQKGLGGEEARFAQRFISTMIPLSMRHEGLRADCRALDTTPRYAMERIAAPTLVLHSTDDPLMPFAWGNTAAKTVPHARLVAFHRGGHLLLGHHEEVRDQLGRFLHEYNFRLVREPDSEMEYSATPEPELVWDV